MSASAAAPSPESITNTDSAPEARPDKRESPLRDALKLLVATSVGKSGVALFALMLAISVYVVLTYPADFGEARWSNPAIWADNPRAVAPVWIGWITPGDEVEHRALSLDEPSEQTESQRGAVTATLRTYRFPLTYDADEFPGFLSMTLTGLTFNDRPPTVAATLVRPDQGRIRLFNLAVPQIPGETAPFRRYYETPERILLTQQPTAAQQVAVFYGTDYAGIAAPANLGDRLNQALFGRPAADGSGRIEPLTGDYVLEIDVLTAHPDDEVAAIEAVMAGTVFGVMGTDTLGRDLWEGLLYGFPIGLLIATVTAVLATFIGTAFGIWSGYAGGTTDAVIQRLVDIISNVPVLPLLIFLVFVLGSQLWLIMLILVAFGWTGLTIIVRTMVLQIRSGQLVEAARALGASRTRIMTRHVFPQVAPFVVAQMIFSAPAAILAEASLSFLGLGDVSIPTWGQMLEAGFRTGALYVGYWWWILPPGILIVVTALAFMLLALAMEPVVDPRLRRTT